tara:strand:+ start:1162 stop:1455 length:294 start_codon:yes stop_codon:yes gene_type:complete
MNANNPANDVYMYETEIADKRDDLFYEITTTGSAAGYSLHDLIETVDDEYKDNIIAMLMVGNDDVKEYAKEHLLESFKEMLDDDAILEIYIDDKSEF